MPARVCCVDCHEGDFFILISNLPSIYQNVSSFQSILFFINTCPNTKIIIPIVGSQ
jgi:hypothetical protein